MSTEKIRRDIDENAAIQRAGLMSGSWWHSIELNDGQVTPGVHSLAELRDNFARFNLPADLGGKTLLDLGCWDGFYSFEAERRGARVTAVDCWRPDNFFRAREALGSTIPFHELSVYEVTQEKLGSFEIVFFLGVLYHLRHPLLALERVCEVTRELAVIETHIIDNVLPTERPVMEFYEFDELGGQYDNWWGPNIECLAQMTRSAGFVRVEILRREPTRATIKAYRQWNDKPSLVSSSLHLRDVLNAVTIDRRYPRSGRHAFLMLLVDGFPALTRRWEVKVDVGGFGANPIYVGPSGDPKNAGLTQINLPVPPGLATGRTNVCVWFEGELSNDFDVELSEGTSW
jgi:tRNA (mo5U34)-methyltransferase